MSKEKLNTKIETKTKREQRDDNYDAANMDIRSAVIQAARDHGVMPIEMFSILSAILADLVNQDLEQQYAELDKD